MRRLLKNLTSQNILPISQSETLYSKITSERVLTDPERLLCWHDSTAPKLFCCNERRFSKDDN
jgi:hypothetical protein